MTELRYEDAMRLLIEGTCGANPSLIQRETGLTRQSVAGFLSNGKDSHRDTVDVLGLFVWRRLNAHLLLCDEDRVATR